jgi:hypothetical protein
MNTLRVFCALLSDLSLPRRGLLFAAALLALTMLGLYVNVLNAAMARGGLVRDAQASPAYALNAVAAEAPPQATLPREVASVIAAAR